MYSEPVSAELPRELIYEFGVAIAILIDCDRGIAYIIVT